MHAILYLEKKSITLSFKIDAMDKNITPSIQLFLRCGVSVLLNAVYDHAIAC